MARLADGTNVYPTRVTVLALLEFLYEWMPLNLLSLCRYISLQGNVNILYKVSDCAGICHAKVKQK